MIKNILFDFDGVILDSMPVREQGFREIFAEYDHILVDKLLQYHHLNGGLSRYVKIKYFFEELLKEPISEEKISEIAMQFSALMRQELTKETYLIGETIEFLERQYETYNFHIVSGSDQEELQFLTKKLGIDGYFITINGSPAPKTLLVKTLMISHKYKDAETILIGDSVNDYEASRDNNIDFYGYNNDSLRHLSKRYIGTFEDFHA